MKTAIAWAVGIAIWLVLDRASYFLGGLIGVPVMVFFDETQFIEHRYYEEEFDSAFTTFGGAITALKLMLAARAGMAVNRQMPSGGVSPRTELQFRSWFIGFALLCVVGAVLYRAFGQPHSNPAGSIGHSVFRILEFGATVGIAWMMKLWYDNSLRTSTVSETQLVRIAEFDHWASRAIDECNNVRKAGGVPTIHYGESSQYLVSDGTNPLPPSG